ncbi:DUF3019 domain-containing protein [Paraglaciecola arctica]|uniref:DUF3019 domain-containing protein n=1 Tax=Paraglaciecola arctica TaxID=1128911 RepID=UPI001C067632|nr:DUF3019 domain-containing protein [Paraglaciecola arctica]MBU3004477.1 DUF3019 domain-containing protein [Paraglaciecola arctica]
MTWISSTLYAICKGISLVCLLSMNRHVWADSTISTTEKNQLLIEPNTCVSLHMNQACFVNLKMRWRTTKPNNYCLYASTQESPLKCWVASNQGIYTQQFTTDKTAYFYLKLQQNDLVIAESELKVSWVYKKQQKSRLTWRLF